MAIFQSFSDMCRVVKNLSHLTGACPPEVKQGHTLLVFLSYCKQMSFRGLSHAAFFTFLHRGFLGDFVVSNSGSAEVLSSFPKLKRAMMCFTEKICVFVKLCSGVSYMALDCKFNVSESTIYIK